MEESDAPHRAMRLRAVLAAYDQLLIQLCERLDVPTDVGCRPCPPASGSPSRPSSSRPVRTGEAPGEDAPADVRRAPAAG